MESRKRVLIGGGGLAGLAAGKRLIDAGYDVRGYFHWSLLNTYEWMMCYEPVYGLYAVNPDKSLTPKASASLYHHYIRSGFMTTTDDVSKWTPERLAASKAVVALEPVAASAGKQAAAQPRNDDSLSNE